MKRLFRKRHAIGFPPAQGQPSGGGSGAVSSVSNSDGSLTISPTTGAVVASLNTGNTNTWTAHQIMKSPASGAIILTVSGPTASSGTTAASSGVLDIVGSYWNGSAGILYGFSLYSSMDSTSPTAHLSVNLFNNGTQTELMRLDNAGNVSVESGSLVVDATYSSGSGLFIGSGSTNNAIWTSSQGSGSSTLYIGNQAIATTTTANVASVSNSDGSLTISPTTGAVVASLNLANANTWTGTQTFGGTASPTVKNSGNGIVIYEPTNTYAVRITTSSWTASHNIALPLVTANDTLAVLGLAQTFSQAQTFSALTTTNGIAGTVTSKSSGSPYSVVSTDEILAITTGASSYTVDLPAATGSGRKLFIEKMDSGAGAVTVTPNGTDTIEGSSSKSLASQYNKIGLFDIASGVWADLGTGGGV